MELNEDPSAHYRQVQEALEDAIEKRDIYLCYQAQNRLDTGQLLGLEALCRIRTETLGDISPEEFIPLAEHAGLIRQLEQLVLEQVAQDLPLLHARYPHARISVNLSARHIVEPGFFTDIQLWLATLPAPMIALLDFEITETSLQYLAPDLMEGLNTLRQQGIRIAMDDFGSGQSSLSRLHMLPFDVIKLDKQFAQQIDHPMVRAIVKAAIDFTTQFQLTLIIEGVETQHQCQAIKDMGGQVVQGFFFGKPAPLDFWLNKK